jgi:hypothetical protein
MITSMQSIIGIKLISNGSSDDFLTRIRWSAG